jgi:hypothetical protein
MAYDVAGKVLSPESDLLTARSFSMPGLRAAIP